MHDISSRVQVYSEGVTSESPQPPDFGPQISQKEILNRRHDLSARTNLGGLSAWLSHDA